MILRHFILKFVCKQTENDYNLTVKCYKRRNYHTLQSVQSQILPFKVWLNSTLTVVQLCYPPLKIHFLLSAGNTLLFFVIPNTLLKMRGVCYCSKKSCKKSSLRPEVGNEMSFEHFFFFVCISHAASCQSPLGWNRFKLIKHIKVFPYTLFHFNLHCTLLRRGCPISQ